MRYVIVLLALATLPACAAQNHAQAPQPLALAQTTATADAPSELQASQQAQRAEARVAPTSGRAPTPGERLVAAQAPAKPENVSDNALADAPANAAVDPPAAGAPLAPPRIVAREQDPGAPAIAPSLAALVRAEAPGPTAFGLPRTPQRFEPGSALLTLDESVVAMIKRDHGLRTEAYQGAAGNWLIGYGRAKGARPGMRISAAEADALLREDLAVVGRQVRAALTRPVSANEYSAMVALAHSIGTGAFRQSAVRRLFNQGDRKAAADAFLRWNRIQADGRRTESAELTARRMKERTHFLAGGIAAAALRETAALEAKPASGEDEPG